MNGIILSLSSCSTWEFVLRDQGEIKVCHFLFLHLMNSMTKHFLDLTCLATQAVLLFLGITHMKQASFPRTKCFKGHRSAVLLVSAVRDTYMSTSPHIWIESTRRIGKKYHMECRSGTIFWNEHQHWQFSYEALTKPLFQHCSFLAKQIHLDNGKERKVLSRRWGSYPFLLDCAAFWYRRWLFLYVIKVQ